MNVHSLRFRLVLWYALWLGGIFVTAGALIYFGLRHYLEHNLGSAQMQRAQRIATLVSRMNLIPEKNLAEEITTRFAPEASSRFIRVSRPDGVVIYESSAPLDQSFNPAQISPPPRQPGTRKETLTDGGELLLATAAASSNGAVRFFVETGESLAPALVELRRLLVLLAVGFVAVAGMALGGGFLLVRRALRPVEEITRSAERITSRNLSERLVVTPTGDEFEHLSQALNRMIARLDEAFQYNRLFLADVSHELRTPLTVVRGELENLVQEECLNSDLHERIGSTLEEAERLARIVEGLFAIARLDVGEAQVEWKVFDLAQLAASTSDQMLLLADDKHIRVTCIAARGAWVEGDRARLKQVVVNLLDNAIKYTMENGTIGLTVAAHDGKTVLEVSDNGIGIPAEALPHVFERFYRVDKARSRELGGAGLGLSIVQSICAAHHGHVEVSSTPGQGSRFRVELPLASTPTEQAGQKS
ncbi:MAG: HAMP domain-containing protein [Verrucomicrobia bacterium]|nr:HAMP domain-containing protein [Verrucomicrobiota bacterium]